MEYLTVNKAGIGENYPLSILMQCISQMNHKLTRKLRHTIEVSCIALVGWQSKSARMLVLHPEYIQSMPKDFATVWNQQLVKQT